MMIEVQKKVCVVTGASRGLGLDIVSRLALAGHRVYALVRDPSSFERAPGSQEAVSSGLAVPVECDVRIPASVARAADWIAQREACIDLLVNNAGIAIPSRFVDVRVEDWLDTIATNLTGAFLCCHAFMGLLRASQGADIINMSSRSGRNPAPQLSAYCASKFGLNGLSEVLQIELMEFGIRVSSIAPGRCATSFAEEKLESWHIPPSAVSDAVLAVLDSDRRVFWGTVEIRPLRRPN